MTQTRGIIKAFAIACSPCECPGTEYKETGVDVLRVEYRVGKNKHGKIRFKCTSCKHRWTQTNVQWQGDEMVLETVR